MAVPPCHVICMKRPTAEKMRMWKGCFNDVKPFDAVVGNSIPLTDLHPITKMHIQSKYGQESFFSVPSMGAVGCYMSHVALWKLCVELDQAIAVMEEDVELGSKETLAIHACLKQVPPDASFLSLMYQSYEDAEPYDATWDRMRGPYHGGTQLYVMFPKGAKLLLKNALPCLTQVDAWIGITCFHHPKEMRAYVLRQRLYTRIMMFKDNLNSSIQTHFAVKKFLPVNNAFYVSAVLVLLGLLCVVVYRLV